ncbi:MAG: histone deacetylase family protein [Elusimicrobiota bacterium]
MSTHKSIPVFFHKDQLEHKPLYEWSFGERLNHPETTKRAESIVAALQADAGRYRFISPSKLPVSALKSLHHPDLVELYKHAMSLPVGETFYPTIFPQRTRTKPNPKRIQHAGYYCFDSGTPLTATTWAAAAWSAACALDAAKYIEKGKSRLTYSLCRPPGHHASARLFGGYCYFNNAALAAKQLRQHGRVAIVDIDFHHGNGTQEFFYDDRKILFISLHGDPAKHYPFFSGYASEKGFGDGYGHNLNIPLEDGCGGDEYLRILESVVVPRLFKFKPSALIVSAGFDTYLSDPVGTFSLTTEDFNAVARVLAGLNVPTMIVQEGGYEESSLGLNVKSFLEGFLDAADLSKEEVP